MKKSSMLAGLALAAMGSHAKAQNAEIRDAYREIYVMCVQAEPQNDTPKCKGFRSGLAYCQMFDVCFSDDMNRKINLVNTFLADLSSFVPGGNTALVPLHGETSQC